MFDFFCEESCSDVPVNHDKFGLTDVKDSKLPAFSTVSERKAYASNSIDINTPVVRQNDIEDFLELGFDFYVKPEIVM